MKRLTKLFALIFSVVVLVTSVLPLVSYADTEEYYDTYDVVFLIDNSYSMQGNDPTELRKKSIEEFSALASITRGYFNDSPRIGYVFFSDRSHNFRSKELTSIDSQESLDFMTQEISSVMVAENGSGDTDIVHGLELAYDKLTDQKNKRADDSKCKKIIVFLSDGSSTYDFREGSLDEDNKKLDKTTLPEMRNEEISVYTIGLGNQIDSKMLTKISGGTGGTSRNVTDAAELRDAFQAIMFDALRISTDELIGKPDADGYWNYTVSIPSGQNISSVEILFILGRPIYENNMRLKDPTGAEVPIKEPNVKKRTTSEAVTITIKDPEAGDWTFGYKVPAQHFGFKCYIVTTESVYFDIISSVGDQAVKNVPGGVNVNFFVQCNPPEDSNMDPDVLEELVDKTTGTITVRDEDGKEYLASYSVPVNLTKDPSDPTRLIATFKFENAGTYTVASEYLDMDGISTNSVNSVTVRVEPIAVKLSKTKRNVNLNAPLFGLDLNTKETIKFNEIVSAFEPGADIKIEKVSDKWDELCKINIDNDKQTITIEALASCSKQNVEFIVKDNYGNSESFTVVLKIFPTWIIPLIIIGGIILIVAAILIVIRVKKPRLGGSLKMSLMLPSNVADKTPPETAFDLTTVSRKGKVALNSVIASNFAVAQQYNEALSAIAAFVQEVNLEAANANSTKLWIYIPSPKNNEAIQFNGVPIEKKAKKALDVNTTSTLVFNSVNGEYRIIFTLGKGGYSVPVDQDYSKSGTFGGNGGANAFGGFGSTDDNGGGFGGTNDNGGFGGFGGTNDNGGFGGFGGTNDNGGFGGFGGTNDNGGANNNGGTFGGF